MSASKCNPYKAWHRNLSGISPTRNVAFMYARRYAYAYSWNLDYKIIVSFSRKHFYHWIGIKISHYTGVFVLRFPLSFDSLSGVKLERDHNVKAQTLVETFHQAYSNSRKIWNSKLILTAGRWRSKQKNPGQKIYIFKQLQKFVTNLLQIHFVTHFLFYFHFSFNPWRRFVFNQEYWAIM